MKVSDCCGASPQSYVGPHGTPDSDSIDHGICPECGDHCEYTEAGESVDSAKDYFEGIHNFQSKGEKS